MGLEAIHLQGNDELPELRRGLAQYFAFSDHARLHQALGYRTPAAACTMPVPGGAAGDDLGPSLQFRPPPEDRLGQAVAHHRQTDDVGAEDRLGFNRHGQDPLRTSAWIAVTRDATS